MSLKLKGVKFLNHTFWIGLVFRKLVGAKVSFFKLSKTLYRVFLEYFLYINFFPAEKSKVADKNKHPIV